MKVLVIVDMQNDFINGPLGTEQARDIVPKIVELIENGGYDRIIATKDTHSKRYLSTHEGRWLPVEHCLWREDGWKIEKNIQRALMRFKGTFSSCCKESFGLITLHSLISDYVSDDVERIDMCGVCTDICVISNAIILRSAMPETDIRIISSACAGTTPQMHEKALNIMRGCHMEVIE